jgi:hypothetical protein
VVICCNISYCYQADMNGAIPVVHSKSDLNNQCNTTFDTTFDDSHTPARSSLRCRSNILYVHFVWLETPRVKGPSIVIRCMMPPSSLGLGQPVRADVKPCRCNKHFQVAVPGGPVWASMGAARAHREDSCALPQSSPQPVGSTTRSGSLEPGGVVLRGRSWQHCESAAAVGEGFRERSSI